MVVILPEKSRRALPRPDRLPRDLVGKSVVIIGALGGLGRATARVFAEVGARVLVVGSTESEVVRALGDLCTVTENENALQGVKADMACQEDIQHVFHEADRLFDGVDVLVFFVEGDRSSVLESDIGYMAHALDAGVRGYVTACQEALARMRERGAGHIVTVAPRTAPNLDPTSEVYAITRAAVGAFTESLSAKTSSAGIHVTLLEPDIGGTPAEEERHEGSIASCLLHCVAQGTQARRVFVHAAPRRVTPL